MFNNKIKLRFLATFGVVLIVVYLINYSSLKYYWHDEIIVLRHLSGYSQQELETYLYDGQPKSYQDLQKFQTVNDEKSWQYSLNSIVNLTSHKPPLYVALLRIWAKIFGNQELVFRSLSIVIYLIFIFCFYHLALILFNDHKISLIATIFTGLSFMNYSLEVWEYGLFALVTALSSLFLLKSLANPQSVKCWVSYSLSLIAGLYTHIFFILIALAHSLYVIVNRSLIHAKNKTYFWWVWIFSLCLYLPWVKIMIDNNFSIYPWAKVRWSLSVFITRWLSYIPGLFSLSGKIFTYGLVGIFIFSLSYLIKQTPQKTWSFIILTITVPFLSLVIYDLFFGTRYSSIGRFYLGTLMGILLSMSFLIRQGLGENNKVIRTISYVLLLGLLSWNLWTKIPYSLDENGFRGYGSQILNAALIVNKSEKPLVISKSWWDLLTFVHKAEKNTSYLFINDLDNVNIDKNYSDIFVLSPSSSFREQLTKEGIFLEETNNKSLWKINFQLK